MPRVIFGALMGAIVWNLITWCCGIPSSSSHALIGGLVGAGMAKAGVGAIVWAGVVKTVAGDRAVAAVGLRARAAPGADGVVDLRALHAVRASTALSAALQFVSASLYSLGHGGNDAQKTMGIIAVLLYSQGYLGSELPRAVLGGDRLPGGDGARHAARRLAHRAHHGLEDHPAHADAGLLRRDRRRDHAVRRDLARHSGLDHAHHHRRIIGVGAAQRLSAVRWSVAKNIVIAWIITIPAAGLIAALFYLAVGLFG